MKIIYCLSLAFICCNSTIEKKRENKYEQRNTENIENPVNKALTEDSIHFFQNCEDLKAHSSIGALQLIKVSKDSAGLFCFAACYDCKETYEIVFNYKCSVEERNMLGLKGIESAFDSGCSNNFNKFDCYAFVTPMIDPDKQKDVHALNINFPTTVKIYKRIFDDRWELKKKIKVKSIKEYIMLQFKTIYEIW